MQIYILSQPDYPFSCYHQGSGMQPYGQQPGCTRLLGSYHHPLLRGIVCKKLHHFKHLNVFIPPGILASSASIPHARVKYFSHSDSSSNSGLDDPMSTLGVGCWVVINSRLIDGGGKHVNPISTLAAFCSNATAEYFHHFSGWNSSVQTGSYGFCAHNLIGNIFWFWFSYGWGIKTENEIRLWLWMPDVSCDGSSFLSSRIMGTLTIWWIALNISKIKWVK